MFGNMFIQIHLNNGTVIVYNNAPSYDEYWNVIGSYEKAEDNELVSFKDEDDNEYLIPKKNISFIKIGE